MIYKTEQIVKLYEMAIKMLETEMGTDLNIAVLIQGINSYGNTINRADLESFGEYLWDKFPDLAYITGELLELSKNQNTVDLSDGYIKALATLTINHKKFAKKFEK